MTTSLPDEITLCSKFLKELQEGHYVDGKLYFALVNVMSELQLEMWQRLKELNEPRED